jgi:2-oxoglutarate-dependent dioxygenase
MTTGAIPHLQLTDGERRFYQEEGYLQIPALVSERDAGDLHREVMELMNSIGGFEGNKLKQSWEYKTGSHIDRLINSPQLRDLAGQMMGGESTLYLPFTAVKGVGGGTFHFHQDNNYTLFDDGMKGINLWIALMPMTPENGCLMVVPRSHRKGTLESVMSPDGDAHQKVKYDPSDFLPVRMRAGDCIAFSRLTVHGSGPNRTNEPRVAYAIQYHRNDASWVDKETGEKKLLTQFPRWTNKPVERYSVPAGKRDGH